MDPALLSPAAESASSPAPSTSASASGSHPHQPPYTVVFPEGSTRKERNRISAQQSRARRKAEFEALKRRVVDLEAENTALRAACRCHYGLGPPVPLVPAPSLGWMQPATDAIEPLPEYVSVENDADRIRRQEEECGEDNRKKKRRRVDARGMENGDHGDGGEKANGKKRGMREATGEAKAACVEETANEIDGHEIEAESKKRQSELDYTIWEHGKAASLEIDGVPLTSPVSAPGPATPFTSSLDVALSMQSPISRYSHGAEQGEPNARRAEEAASPNRMAKHDNKKQPRLKKRRWAPDHLYSLRRTTRSLKADIPGLYDHVIRDREERERERSTSLDGTDGPSIVSAEEPPASTSSFSWADPNPVQSPSRRRTSISPVEDALSVELASRELSLATATEELVLGKGEGERDAARSTIDHPRPATTPARGRSRSRSVSGSSPRSLSAPRVKNGDGDGTDAGLDVQEIVQDVDPDGEDAVVLLIQPPPPQQQKEVDVQAQAHPPLETKTEADADRDGNGEITMAPAQPLPPPPLPLPLPPPVLPLPSPFSGVSSSPSPQPQKQPPTKPRSSWDQRVRARLNELGSVRARPQTGVQGRAPAPAPAHRYRNSTGGGSGTIGDQLLLLSNIRNLHRQSLA